MSNDSFDNFLDSVKEKFAIGIMVLLALFTTINAAIVTFKQNYNGFVIAFIVVAITLVVASGYIIYLLCRRRRAYRRITKESILRVIRREGYYPKVDSEVILALRLAMQFFPERFAYILNEDPRHIERRNEMMAELKPLIEKYGFEVEDDKESFGVYKNELQSPANDYIITMSSLDEVPF